MRSNLFQTFTVLAKFVVQVVSHNLEKNENENTSNSDLVQETHLAVFAVFDIFSTIQEPFGDFVR